MWWDVDLPCDTNIFIFANVVLVSQEQIGHQVLAETE